MLFSIKSKSIVKHNNERSKALKYREITGNYEILHIICTRRAAVANDLSWIP